MCCDVGKACPRYPDAHHILQSDDLAIANIYATLETSNTADDSPKSLLYHTSSKHQILSIGVRKHPM